MNDMDEKPNRPISDDGKMQRVMEMASLLMSKRGEAQSPAPLPEAPLAAEDAASNSISNIAEMLGGMMSQKSEAPAAGSASSDPAPATVSKIGAIAEALPTLMQGMSGKGNFIKSERLNLVQAMRPYMNEARLLSMDRAIKMANMASAAKEALHILGR